MSTVGGYLCDKDDIISINLGIVIRFLLKIQDNFNKKSAKKIIDAVFEEMEEGGLREEDDGLIFHTDNTEMSGTVNSAAFLKQVMFT
ncbi:MAG: hypothetical protein EZS28_027658 [Streblomastix strix]|uniref:Uncharacterized protein n=1 Tax=Streblomastix strix TaxID=222440 RepID=A0A5J4V457_9EUKA|nr:MAG: hypothetical protein EZS28_027658 [Streblomastix strix]